MKRSMIFFAALIFPAATLAATLDVGPSGHTYTSPKAGMDAASAGDTVLVYAGTYSIAATIAWVDGVRMLAAPGAAPVFDAGLARRIISVTNCTDRRNELRGITLQNGYQGDYNAGAAILATSTPNKGYFKITRCTFFRDSTNVAPTNNTSYGGAVRFSHETAIIDSCSFTRCWIFHKAVNWGLSTGDQGGGAIGHTGAAGDSLIVLSSVFTDCHVGGGKDGTVLQGGAINAVTTALDSIATCVFVGNTAQSAGAVHSWHPASGGATVTGCTFTGNAALGADVTPGNSIAGALYMDHGAVNVTHSTFTGNKCKGSGGGLMFHGNGAVSYCTFQGDTAGTGGSTGQAAVGGGLWNAAGSPVDHCEFRDCAAVEGAGLFTGTATSLLADVGTVSYCLFAGNSVGSGTYSAGAAACARMASGVHWAFDHCTFVDNFCGATGRGSVLAESTLAGNTVYTDLASCVLAWNTTKALPGPLEASTAAAWGASCCNFYGNPLNGTWTAQTDCLVDWNYDPCFVGRPAGDFQLARWSQDRPGIGNHPIGCADIWGYTDATQRRRPAGRGPASGSPIWGWFDQ